MILLICNRESMKMKKLFKTTLVIAIIFTFGIITVYADTPDNTLEISTQSMNCKELLGNNLTLVLNAAIKLIRIVGAALATLLASVTLFKAIGSDNKDALKKAGNTCVKMGIVLIVIGLFPTLIRFIGNLFEFDISCIL